MVGGFLPGLEPAALLSKAETLMVMARGTRRKARKASMVSTACERRFYAEAAVS
jgi:hypothetical protein